MKTKFDSIVKVKKQAIDNIQRNIQKINASIQKLKEEIDSLNSSFLSLEIPKEGNFAILNQIKHQQSILRDEIKRLENQVVILENRKRELLKELKKANIEYEKMKYLQSEEIKKELKRLKLKELREMDELAILLRKSNES